MGNMVLRSKLIKMADFLNELFQNQNEGTRCWLR